MESLGCSFQSLDLHYSGGFTVNGIVGDFPIDVPL